MFLAVLLRTIDDFNNEDFILTIININASKIKELHTRYIDAQRKPKTGVKRLILGSLGYDCM